MSFDYTFKIEDPTTGQIAETGYQEFIKGADIQDEVVHGQPLKEGGAPQAVFVKLMIEKVGLKVRVFFNGNEIL